MPWYEFPTEDTSKAAEIQGFAGVDFSTEITGIAANRSPDSLNMTFSKFGAPIKRGGIRRVARTPNGGQINGIFILDDTVFVHAGTNMYIWNTDAEFANTFDWTNIDYTNFTFNTDPLLQPQRGDFTPLREISAYDDMSYAWQFGGYLYWLDQGNNFLRIDTSGASVPVASLAYVPTTRIGAAPDGTGGQFYEAVNVLTNKQYNTFSADGQATMFQLSTKPIDVLNVQVELLVNGVWEIQSESSYAVLGDDGVVDFNTAPPAPTAAGEDNVRICFAPDAPYYTYVQNCTMGYKWNVNNGSCLVLTRTLGRNDLQNHDWTSMYNDPTYFPDTMESIVGTDNVGIQAYHTLNGDLIIFTSDDDEYATTYHRSMQVSDSFDVLPTTREIFKGLSCVSQECVSDLTGDQLFLSSRGVFNLAESTTTNSRYATARSSYINGKLLKQDLTGARMTVVGNRLYLFVGSSVYVADKYFFAKSPVSSHDLEWLYWEIPKAMRYTTQCKPSKYGFPDIVESVLTMGDVDGYIYQYADGEGKDSYVDWVTDQFTPIRARWTTPYMDLSAFSNYKSVKRLYLLMLPYPRTAVQVYGKVKGGWNLLGEESISVFSFEDFDFNNFSFLGEVNAYVAKFRTRLRRELLVQLRFENNNLREQFSIFALRMIYKVGGYGR